MAARLAVVGAGWAGLAAAVRARQSGLDVTLFEMSSQAGGRARSMTLDGKRFDNGQHILIGAYRRSQDLMRTVGAVPEKLLLRMPLVLQFPDGRGLRLPSGPPLLSMLRGIAGARGWSWRDRAALLAQALRWQRSGFGCAADLSVEQLCSALPRTVREGLIDPLCLAALNTPAPRASAAVFLRVLRDALLGPRGSADLLLPRVPLAALMPEPALDWLRRQGAAVRLACRVGAVHAQGAHWRVDGEAFDAVVLATTAIEAARLAEPIAPGWAQCARAVEHDAIVTVTLASAGTRLAAPMLALREGPAAPAQFVFDHGALGLAQGRFVAVVSGAASWLEHSLDQVGELVRTQLQAAFAPGTWRQPLTVVKVIAEKRATFRCSPNLARPPSLIAPGLAAAGDYVNGPYPATLEGAVMSGEAALSLCRPHFRHAESRIAAESTTNPP